MLSSPSANIFGSLNYLFQEQSSKEGQPLPNAPFSLTGAVSGGNAFASPLAPDQQPKKRKIYLDYASFYRLWRPEQLALIIAKLQQEEFEVAFIQNDVNGNIFASSIEDKAEGDNKYDYKFKDKNGKEIGIFELSDDFIKENFSKLDHENSIERLGLVRDESIILSFEQFDQIHKVFTQEHWDDKERVSVRSSLSYDFLDGAVEKRESYKSIVASVASIDDKNELSEIYDKFKNLFTHEDFNIEDPDTLVALNKLKELNYPSNCEYILRDIKNEKTLEALFDKIPSLSFFGDYRARDEKAKIIMQKSILKELWFKCSDFEAVVKRARTLNEFSGKTPHDIADLIYKNDLYTLTNHILLTPEPPSFDILERCPEKSVLDIFESKGANIRIFSVITEQRKKETSFGKKIEVSFIFSSDADDGSFEFSLKLSDKEYNDSLRLSHFINIFSNSEINQHFNLTEKFGDTIIDYFEQKTLLELCNSINNKDYPNFLEQLHDDQKKTIFKFIAKSN
jgi:hypothetical protein